MLQEQTLHFSTTAQTEATTSEVRKTKILRENFETGTQVSGTKLRAVSTLATLPPFSCTVATAAAAAAVLYCKCAISWGGKKLTRGYFLTLLTFGCGALTLPSGTQSPSTVVFADDSFSRCVKTSSKSCAHSLLRLLSVAPSLFYRSWLSALLPSHFPAQHGAGKGECVGTNMKRAESDETERKRPSD